MPNNDHDHYLDPYAYPPEFTPEDELIAQQEGFPNAYDRWKYLLDGKLADDGRKRIEFWAKGESVKDLVGEGMSTAHLAALSDESLHLPRDPDYRADEPEVRTHKQPYLRHAQFVGACNRLIDIHARLEKYDLYLDMDSSNLYGDRLSAFQWAHIERSKVADTLEALGEDIEDVEARIESGEIEYQDRIEAPNIISDDPDLQRIDEAYEDELRQAGIEVEDREELTVDLRSSRPAPGKTPRLIASQEDGPAHYEDTSSDELQSRVRTGSMPRSQGSHVRDHEVGMMKERLAELEELLSALGGYTRETSIEEVAPQDRSAWGRLMAERGRIAGDLAELTESIKEVEQELDEEQTVYEGETDYEYADEGNDAGRTLDGPYESVDMYGEGGDALDVDDFGGEMDGFDGMDGW